MKKIFITGGHFTPALAVIRLLLNEGEWEIFYVGRRYAMEDDKAEALEYQEIKKISKVSYLVINTGRLQRKFFVRVFQSLKALAKVALGFLQSFYWILKYRPNIILSFGGYVAVPVVISAWLFRIPVITHEQTVVSGLSNRIIARFATKILVSWPESLAHFPKGKAILTGNPLRQEIVEKVKKLPTPRLAGRQADHQLKTIYITGGNQGAHPINNVVAEALPLLLKKYTIIHQAGASEVYKDFEKLSLLKEKLPKSLQQKYHLYQFLGSSQVADTLAKADLVISRSGANIVTELAILRKVAILIPIPWASGGEQMANARFLAQHGGAVILEQPKLTAPSLLHTISEIANNWAIYRRQTENASQFVSLDAAQKIVSEIKNV